MHAVDFRPVIFKLQQEVLQFNDICVSWSSPKRRRRIYLSLKNLQRKIPIITIRLEQIKLYTNIC